MSHPPSLPKKWAYVPINVTGSYQHKKSFPKKNNHSLKLKVYQYLQKSILSKFKIVKIQFSIQGLFKHIFSWETYLLFLPFLQLLYITTKIWGRTRAKPLWLYFNTPQRNFVRQSLLLGFFFSPCKSIIELAVFKAQKDWKLAFLAKLYFWISPQHLLSRQCSFASSTVFCHFQSSGFLLSPSPAIAHIQLLHLHLNKISVYSCYKMTNFLLLDLELPFFDNY